MSSDRAGDENGSEYFIIVVDRQRLPHEGHIEEFLFDGSMLDHLDHNAPIWQLDMVDRVEPTLNDPDSIFTGLNRMGFDDCLCYAKRINAMMMLLAFARITPDGRMLFFDWTQRAVDNLNANLPVDSTHDFGDPIYERGERARPTSPRRNSQN